MLKPAVVVLAALSLGAHAAPEVVASAPLADVDVPSTGASALVTFSGVPDSVTGVALSGLWTGVVRDNGGGSYPWSAEFALTAQAPGGQSASSPSPWFGEISIADYPLADGFTGLPGVNANGDWTLTFDSGAPAPYVAGVRDGMVHLLADGPDLTYQYAETTGQGNSWNRPFSIVGVSGLGPVDYHALTFTVSRSGVYDFTSVLDSGDDHFTILYKDAFDDTQPLANIHDYGLGNGFSPFDTPEGTSAFSQLLFEGTTYIWVTSQWASFRPNGGFVNTIVGPGEVLVAGGACNAADLAEPFGTLDFSDVTAFLTAFATSSGEADLAEPFGTFDFSDVVAFLAAFGAGCP
ncbi:MAG: GC-type dockerin domain-anchored protein [Phycisphaerales bacterium JB059]